MADSQRGALLRRTASQCVRCASMSSRAPRPRHSALRGELFRVRRVEAFRSLN
jgi:hypothetical protein